MNKTVVVGVCGGIAAYKACDIVSKLKKKNYHVIVVMTKSAAEFVTPLTFMTLSRNHVVTHMFEEPAHYDVEHISIAKQASLFLIVPATANIIGKIASGIADDFLTTTVMATKAPVLIAPAMNTGMWTNPILQNNVQKLKDLGYAFVPPGTGALACGDAGAGRLAETDHILAHAEQLLCEKKDLTGKHVLVTAGATIERIDPVRYLTNPSTGKMGYAVATAALQRGASVTVVAGKTALPDVYGAKTIKVQSALEMLEAVEKESRYADIIIKSAAVGDYRAETVAENKIKKTDDILCVHLIKNPDILKRLGEKKDGKILVGFAMETQDLVENAREKLQKKNLDMVVANNLSDAGAGFAGDTNVVTVLMRSGEIKHYPKMTKDEVAHMIFDRISAL